MAITIQQLPIVTLINYTMSYKQVIVVTQVLSCLPEGVHIWQTTNACVTIIM